MSNREFLEDWFHRVWVDGELDLIDQTILPETIADGLVPDLALHGEDLKVLVTTMHGLVDHPQVIFEKILENGDWISALMTAQAVAKTTGNPIRISTYIMARIVDGKFAETYNSFDFVGFFEQIGGLPQNSMAMMMAGQTLH